MASLRDKVNTTLIRRNGQLVEESSIGAPPTPTSQLAGQAGLGAPPTTPAGVGALGGTPKQQDMAGSGTQKQNALRQSLDTSNTLQEAEADKRYRSSLTSEEEAKVGKEKRLGEVFGTTQQKVQDLIGAELERQTNSINAPRFQTAGVLTAATGDINPTNTGYKQLFDAAPDKQVLVNTEFAKLMDNPTGPMSPIYIEKLMAFTGLDEDRIKAAAQEAATTQGSAQKIGQLAATSTNADKVNVTGLLPQLGTTREELAELLGIEPTVIDTMDIASLDEAVKGVQAQGVDVAEVERAAQDTSLGAAERAAMREASREQSTTGFAAEEAQLEDLGHSLESAETIDFGGQKYTVQQLLSDDTISKVLSDYLTNPDSEQSKRLAADPAAKGLLAFANRYRTVLSNAVSDVVKAIQGHKDIVSYNQKLAEVAPGITIPNNVMKILYPAWGTSNVGKYESKGIVKALKGMSPEDVQKYSAQLGEMFAMASTDKKAASAIGQFDSAKLLKFITPDGHGGTPMSRMGNNVKAKEDLESKKGNVDALVDLYFGAGSSANIQQLVQGNEASRLLGLGVGGDLLLLDSNKDGKIDSNAADALYKTISKGLTSADSIGEVLTGATGFGQHSNPAGLDAEIQSAYNTLGGAKTISQNGLKLSIENALKGVNFNVPYVGGGVSGPDVAFLGTLKKLPIYTSNPKLAAKIDATLDDQTWRKLRAEGQPIPGDLTDRMNARKFKISVEDAKKQREMGEKSAANPGFQGTAANPYAFMS